ncbi:B box and SPRY domain-containing protein [Willisornis vidua]|uniref:B box and SPRY domain-containing protein n=1 Tax=Willisornis vidua TaxID=1566151 RepID=A0ABQ9DVE0_9PASS|nr:B box and SPRY domain-containing protein [Willisornis vidua]
MALLTPPDVTSPALESLREAGSEPVVSGQEVDALWVPVMGVALWGVNGDILCPCDGDDPVGVSGAILGPCDGCGPVGVNGAILGPCDGDDSVGISGTILGPCDGGGPMGSAASAARELVIQRLLFVGKACENEEQQLLERVHAEEERAHQSILTQQVHWTEALHKLGALRTYLVDMITNLDDQGLVRAEQEIFESTALLGILREGELTCGVSVTSGVSSSQEIHIDEKTLSPHLSLSEDKRTLTFSPKKAKVDLDCPERFDHWPNALATAAFHSGVCAWKVGVEQSCAYKLGVCYSSVPRKGSANEGRLGFNAASWVFSRYDKEFRFLHAGQPQPVELIKAPAQLGVLLDFAGGEVLFYDPDSCAILFSHRETFSEPVYPVFAVAHQSISLVQ